MRFALRGSRQWATPGAGLGGPSSCRGSRSANGDARPVAIGRATLAACRKVAAATRRATGSSPVRLKVMLAVGRGPRAARGGIGHRTFPRSYTGPRQSGQSKPFPECVKKFPGGCLALPTGAHCGCLRVASAPRREFLEGSESIMQTVIHFLAKSLMLLNTFGGIISGIWLAILGEWWAIGYGLVAYFAGPFGLGLLLLAGGILFGPPAVLLGKNSKFVVSYFFMALSLAYAFFVVSAWCLFIFYFFLSHADVETFWPLLVWSYGTALSPLWYMASKAESDIHASVTITIFAQIAYIAVAVVAIFVPMSLLEFEQIFGGLMTQVFGGVMTIGLLLQLTLATDVMPQERR